MEHSQFSSPTAPPSKIIQIRRILQKNGVSLSDGQAAQVERFVEHLLDWNSRINLISRKDIDAIWEAHILHSFALIFKGRIPSSVAVLDVGTGGGLPGIPIAIARADVRVTMLDATKKKTEAVRDMVDALGLMNATVLWGRAEELSKRYGMASSFDVVVARAVAPLADLVKWSKPFLRQTPSSGTGLPALLTLKGGDLANEVEKLQRGGTPLSVSVEALVFEGSELLPGVDKKIVTVRFGKGS